jgi:hypothetical protein
MKHHGDVPHRTRRPLLIAVFVAVAIMLVPSTAGAAILAPKVATVTISVAKGQCTLAFKSIDQATGDMTFKLSATASPTHFEGYFNNKDTTVACFVGFESGASSYYFHRAGPTLSQATTIDLPYEPSFTLCAELAVIRLNGDTIQSPNDCI